METEKRFEAVILDKLVGLHLKAATDFYITYLKQIKYLFFHGELYVCLYYTLCGQNGSGE